MNLMDIQFHNFPCLIVYKKYKITFYTYIHSYLHYSQTLSLLNSFLLADTNLSKSYSNHHPNHMHVL